MYEKLYSAAVPGQDFPALPAHPQPNSPDSPARAPLLTYIDPFTLQENSVCCMLLTGELQQQPLSIIPMGTVCIQLYECTNSRVPIIPSKNNADGILTLRNSIFIGIPRNFTEFHYLFPAEF